LFWGHLDSTGRMMTIVQVEDVCYLLNNQTQLIIANLYNKVKTAFSGLKPALAFA